MRLAVDCTDQWFTEDALIPVACQKSIALHLGGHQYMSLSRLRKRQPCCHVQRLRGTIPGGDAGNPLKSPACDTDRYADLVAVEFADQIFRRLQGLGYASQINRATVRIRKERTRISTDMLEEKS